MLGELGLNLSRNSGKGYWLEQGRVTCLPTSADKEGVHLPSSFHLFGWKLFPSASAPSTSGLLVSGISGMPSQVRTIQKRCVGLISKGSECWGCRGQRMRYPTEPAIGGSSWKDKAQPIVSSAYEDSTQFCMKIQFTDMGKNSGKFSVFLDLIS